MIQMIAKILNGTPSNQAIIYLNMTFPHKAHTPPTDGSVCSFVLILMMTSV